jgi:hypothetical protein
MMCGKYTEWPCTDADGRRQAPSLIFGFTQGGWPGLPSTDLGVGVRLLSGAPRSSLPLSRRRDRPKREPDRKPTGIHVMGSPAQARVFGTVTMDSS